MVPPHVRSLEATPTPPVRPFRLLAGLAAAALLVGCAEVRPPSAAAPLVAGQPRPVAGVGASAPGVTGSDAEGGTAHEEAQPAGFDASEESEPDADEELEDDHDSGDFAACLDRGPSKPPHCPQFSWKSPLEGLSAAEIERKVKSDLGSIGPISIGLPNAGRLFNGVRMPDNERWTLTDPGDAYGTQETVDSIKRAIDKVFAKYADSPKVIIGHLSAKSGGRLRPHKSHQAGRDVDLSYFYNQKVGWYTYATEQNLDRGRTWTFVKAFLEDPNTEMVLVDTSIQRLLYDYAKEHGEDQEFLDRVFQVAGKNPSAIIRHVHGHQTHIHVRFFSPSAQASGKLAAAYLPKPPPPAKRGKGKHREKVDVADNDRGSHSSRKAKNGEIARAKEEDTFFVHRARSGDTLDSLARRYGVSVEAIKQANGLRSNSLKEKKSYRIPKPDHPVASTSSPGKGRKR